MCTLRQLTRLFDFDRQDLPPEMRSQRVLNKSRIPQIARYISDNPESYILSAITASIDASVEFTAIGRGSSEQRMGKLRIPMNAKILINDGQHRRLAIAKVLEQKPELENETIAVVFFLDIGLERSQQMFADLNRYAIRPSSSLVVLYDHRDARAKLAKLVVMNSPLFKDVVEMEKSSLAPRSLKLFTLSAIRNATVELVSGLTNGSIDHDATRAMDFWEAVARQFPEWIMVRDGKKPAKEIRQEHIHSHGIALQALGKAGNALLARTPTAWKTQLRQLRNIDWSRKNAKLWEGRAIVGGKVSKATTNVILVTNVIKKNLNLPLSPSEQKIEDAFSRRKR